MKNFKRFVALVLCALMLVGIAPIALDLNKDVVAVEASSEIDAVVQGPRDAVIIYDNASITMRDAFGAFVGNKVLCSDGNKYGVGGVANGEAYDRIILVMAVSERLGAKSGTTGDTAFEHGSLFFTDCEKIVITSKCYAEYTDSIYTYTDKTYKSLVKYDENPKDDLLTDNLIDKTADVVFTLIENGSANSARVACDLAFEYITIKFAKNDLFYLCGYDFYISDTVKFTYATNTNEYRPIVVNGTDGNTTNRIYNFNSEKTQTVTLNGGEYQYVSLRTRARAKTYDGYNITLNLGAVSLLRAASPNANAFFSNDVFANTTMTVNIDGTTFETPVYLVHGGSNSNAKNPSVTNCTLNVNVKSADFKKGIGAILQSKDQSACTVNSLAVNMHIDSCTVGNGFKIEAETADIADAVTSKIEYTKGASFGELLVGFDTVTTFEGNLCAEGHTYVPMLVEDECHYACFYCSTIDATKTVSIDEDTEAPIIYVSDASGNDENDGLTAETAVKNIWKAVEILSAWQKGGYVALKGTGEQNIRHHIKVNNVDSTIFADVGGTLYIDGNYNNINGEDGTQSIVTSVSGFVYFESDTVMKNIKLKNVTSHKVFILNYNDFTAIDNCSMENVDRYNYTLMTGSFNNGTEVIGKYAKDKVVDQTVMLDGFSFQSIMTGTKSIQKDEVNGVRVVRFSREYSINCSGLTKLFIGENSKVEAINVRKYHYNSTTGIVDTYTAPDVKISMHAAAVPAAGIKFVQNQTHEASDRVYNYDSKSPNYMMFDDDRALIIYGDDFSDIASVFTVYDENAFALKAKGFKEGTDAAMRVTFAEVDGSLQADNVAEFGVLFTLDSNILNITYVDTIEGAVNGVAKSLCYDKANKVNNYVYDGEAPAYFHGVIEFGDLDRDTYYSTQFVASPYAVLEVGAAAGVTGSVAAEYTVIGGYFGTSFAHVANAAN